MGKDESMLAYDHTCTCDLMFMIFCGYVWSSCGNSAFAKILAWSDYIFQVRKVN